IQDMETGFKAMRTDLMRRLRLSGHRFDIEPEITGRILRLGYRIHEVPIDYYARSRAEGKKLTWRDGVKALGTLARVRLASRRRPMPQPGTISPRSASSTAPDPRATWVAIRALNCSMPAGITSRMRREVPIPSSARTRPRIGSTSRREGRAASI